METFASLLAEIRAYGEGLIVAEQIPSKLVPDVIKNTAVKIVHRLPAQDDRDAVGATMNITEAQSQFLVTLTPGEGAVFTDGWTSRTWCAYRTARRWSGWRRSRPRASWSPPERDLRDGLPRLPCTLRDMRTAQRVVADRTDLVLWAELSATAHLTGWGSPDPVPSVLDGLPRRLRDCAVSHAVDAAVASRAAPRELADHLMAVWHGESCADDETSYFAPPTAGASSWRNCSEPTRRPRRRPPSSQ